MYRSLLGAILALSLTSTAGQAGTQSEPAVTNKAATSGNLKKPVVAAAKAAPVTQAQPKKAPQATIVDAKTAAAAKTTEVKKAPDAKTVTIKTAPAAKTAEVKKAPDAKTVVIKTAPAAKTAEVKKAPDAQSGEIKKAPAAKTAEIKKAPNAVTAETKKSAPGEEKKVSESKAKSGKGEVSVKETAKIEHVREVRIPRAGLVPPPPPETPSMLSGPGYGGGLYMQQYMPVEMLSPESLKARQKQLTAQLKNAQDQAKDRQSRLGDKGDRAKQFESLYQEGVISRRELETAQDDIKQAHNDFNDAKARVDDLQTALGRVNDKLKALSKYGPSAKHVASSTKKAKLKHADTSAKVDQPGAARTALKPAGIHDEATAVSHPPAPSPTQASAPMQASTQSPAPTPAPAAAQPDQATTESSVDAPRTQTVPAQSAR